MNPGRQFNDGNPTRPWTAEEDALLGTDVAPVIAARIGRTVWAVRGRRQRLGLPPIQDSRSCEQCGAQFEKRAAIGTPKRFCEACAAERTRIGQKRTGRAWIDANRDRVNANQRRSRMRRHFGMTRDDYDLMLASQAGVCAICQAEQSDSYQRRFYIDHDHMSGAVRGLLCGACNMGIGQLKDDPAVLRAAAAYIEQNRLRIVAGGRG